MKKGKALYLKEKWILEKKKKMGGSFSKEASEYLITEEFRIFVSLLEHLISYCLRPEDKIYKENFHTVIIDYPQETRDLYTILEIYTLENNLIDEFLFFSKAINEDIRDIELEKREQYVKNIVPAIKCYTNMVDSVYSEQAPEATTSEKTAKEILEKEYPQFSEHLPTLIEEGFLIELEGGYHWRKSKGALALYFHNYLRKKRDCTKWSLIEEAFNETGLRNNSKSIYNTNTFRKKPRDYQDLLKVLGISREG